MVVFAAFNIGCICGLFDGSLYGVYLWLFLLQSVWGVFVVVVVVFNIGCICGCFCGSLYGVYLWLLWW